jgi:hypothetical protein
MVQAQLPFEAEADKPTENISGDPKPKYILSDRVMQLQPKLTELYNLVKKVDAGDKKWKLIKRIAHIYELMEPLADKRTLVRVLSVRDELHKEELYVSEKIIVKDYYQSVGRSPSDEYLLRYIKEHYKDITPHVRQKNRERFFKVSEQVAEINFFALNNFRVEIPKTRIQEIQLKTDLEGSEEGVRVECFTANYIEIDAFNDRIFQLLNLKDASEKEVDYKHQQSIQFGSEDELFKLEPVIDYAIMAYKKVLEEVQRLIEYNAPFIKRIEDIMADLLIADSLKLDRKS